MKRVLVSLGLVFVFEAVVAVSACVLFFHFVRTVFKLVRANLQKVVFELTVDLRSCQTS